MLLQRIRGSGEAVAEQNAEGWKWPYQEPPTRGWPWNTRAYQSLYANLTRRGA